jgi:ABC-2 type transport system ATP-binding protein
VIEVRARNAADLPDLARALAHVGSDRARLDSAANRLTLAVSTGPLAITAAVRALGELGIEVDDIGLRRPTLDEVFLAVTGAPAESAEHEPAA